MFSAILIHCLLLNIVIIYSKTDEQIIKQKYFSLGNGNEPANTASLINKINAKKQSGNIKTNVYLSINSCHKFLFFVPIIADELHRSKNKISLLTHKKTQPSSEPHAGFFESNDAIPTQFLAHA